MDLLTHASAVDGLWADANPGTGFEGTVLHADAQNALLQEIYNAIDAAGITHDADDLTQLTQAIRTLGVGNGGLRNAVINADFDVWQRGESFASIGVAEVYTADRWAAVGDGTGGAGLALVTRQGFTLSESEASAPGATSFLRYQQTSASDEGGGRIRHKIEGIHRFAATPVTVSLALRAGSGTPDVNVRLVNVFGQGSTQQTANELVSLTTSWQQVTFTVTMPTLVGQSINAATAHLLLELVLPEGSPTVDVARVQVERASLPGGFEFRPAGLELALCQRYYEKTYELATAPGTATLLGVSVSNEQGTALHSLSTRFRVPKRAVPTMRWWNPAASNALNLVLQQNVGVAHTVTQTVETSRSSTGWPVIATTIPTLTRFFAHWSADAEL